MHNTLSQSNNNSFSWEYFFSRKEFQWKLFTLWIILSNQDVVSKTTCCYLVLSSDETFSQLTHAWWKLKITIVIADYVVYRAKMPNARWVQLLSWKFAILYQYKFSIWGFWILCKASNLELSLWAMEMWWEFLTVSHLINQIINQERLALLQG